MRFVFSIALKYLIPRWRQLSVSIISLVSVLVISLVVWLVVVFLSVTEGIESNWVKQLVAINAPLRMTPNEAYYKSYYYLIDQLSAESGYTSKTLGEKLVASVADPYDPDFDAELPSHFPLPDVGSETIKDIVKEGWEAISSLKYQGVRAQEFEVTFGNLRLSLLREDPATQDTMQSFLSQVSYVASHDPKNQNLQKLILSPSAKDYTNVLSALVHTEDTIDEDDSYAKREANQEEMENKLSSFFNQVTITALKTTENGFILPRSLFPEEGDFSALGILSKNSVKRVVIPQDLHLLNELQVRLSREHEEVVRGKVHFIQGRPTFIPEDGSIAPSKRISLYLDADVLLNAELVSESLATAEALNNIQFRVDTIIQGNLLKGKIPFEHLSIATTALKPQASEEESLWISKNAEGFTIPVDTPLGDGLLVSKNFQNNGVLIGDRGYLSYYTSTTSGMQEMRLPIYVAGFYDPGLMPTGSKLVFVDSKVTAALRGNHQLADQMLGNGFNIWISKLEDVHHAKISLIKALEEKGIAKYWDVQSFEDYDFAKPVLQQLKSDKNLFTLIAIIILVVACSNIISMLILLVNDKKKEIGILQSLGASSLNIASIFGLCGFLTGLLSSIIGVVIAMFTLRHLHYLVSFLNFLQGQEAFQAAFYGDVLPNELSMNALIFVLAATTLISLLAGVIPAMKAARIRPSEMLRSE